MGTSVAFWIYIVTFHLHNETRVMRPCAYITSKYCTVRIFVLHHINGPYRH